MSSQEPMASTLDGFRDLLHEALARIAPASALPAPVDARSPSVRATVDELSAAAAVEALWAEKTGSPLPAGALTEALRALLQRLDAHGALASQADWPLCEPAQPGRQEGEMQALLFPLLLEASAPAAPSPYLTGEAHEAVARLERLDRAGLVV